MPRGVRKVAIEHTIEPIEQPVEPPTPEPPVIEPRSERAVYRSRKEEPTEFPILGVRASRNPAYPGHIEYLVPQRLVDAFDAHFHIRRQRIIRVG